MNSQNRTRLFLSLLLTMFAVSVSAAVQEPYEVGKWGDFAQGAVTFTFDDNTPNQIDVAMPLFDAKGFHMTMFVVIGWGVNWSKYKPAVAGGHEVGSHSIEHGNPMPANEAGPSQDSIKKNLPGEMAVSIAYPNCTVPDENEIKKYYIAGRTCFSGSPINNSTPSNFFRLGSEICGTQGKNTVKDLTDLADNAASQKGWGVYLMHGVGQEPEGSSDYSPIEPSIIEGTLDYLDKNRDKIWVETMGNVARYINERNAADISQKDSTDKGITVSITDDLADSIFNFPLTVRRPLPDGWTTVFVTQDGKEIEDSVVTVGSDKFVQFKAVPDGGDVVISKKEPTGTRRRTGYNTTLSAPVQLQRNSLVINPAHFGNAALQVTLSDINGRVLARESITGTREGIILPVERFATTALIANISGGGRSWSGVFVTTR